MHTTERMLFLKKFIQDPLKIGSITPSSHYLTARVFRHMQWEKVNTIVELGAGTGNFTAHIAAHKKESCRALIIEQDPELRMYLKTTYPDLIIGDEAEKLTHLLATRGVRQVDCIISSLPFAAFPQEQTEAILQEIFVALKPDGDFITYQYSLQLKEQLTCYFTQVDVGFEFFNIPPAFIYYCKK